MRLSSNRSSTSAARRSASRWIVARYRSTVSGSSTTPSFRASTMARMPASGVRRSCDTQAMSRAVTARPAAPWRGPRRAAGPSCRARRASRVRSSGAEDATVGRAASSAPMPRVTSPSARLARSTSSPRCSAASTATIPAPTRITNSALRSWVETNMAFAATTAPSMVPAIATSTTTTAWRARRRDRPPSRRRPATPTTSDTPKEMPTRATVSASGHAERARR